MLGEARGRGGEAHIVLGEVQLSGIAPAPLVLLVTLGDVGGRDGELGIDLVEGVLGGR